MHRPQADGPDNTPDPMAYRHQAAVVLPRNCHEAVKTVVTWAQHWPLAETTADGQQLPLTSIVPLQVGGISQNSPRWPGLHVQTPALHTPCRAA